MHYGEEECSEAKLLSQYTIAMIPQAYREIVSCFRFLSKDNVLQLYFLQQLSVQK